MRRTKRQKDDLQINTGHAGILPETDCRRSFGDKKRNGAGIAVCVNWVRQDLRNIL